MQNAVERERFLTCYYKNSPIWITSHFENFSEKPSFRIQEISNTTTAFMFLIWISDGIQFPECTSNELCLLCLNLHSNLINQKCANFFIFLLSI
jgi:hypothetical protein